VNRIKYIIIIALSAKILYFLYAILVGYKPNLEIFQRNDSYWYEKIATNGHSKITPDQLGSCEENKLTQSYYAFFPLYPLIVGISMKLAAVDFMTVAFFYSLIFSLLLFVLFYEFVKKVFGSEQIAFNSTLFLILSPFHFYFSVFYTETLFLLLLVGSFFLIYLKKMFSFSLLCSLLVLVRPNGLFMLFPLFLFFMEQEKLLEKFRLKNFHSIKKLKVFYFFIPVFSFFLYCYYLKIMTGDFFAYKTAQAGWCRETVLPWTPIFNSSNWIDFFNSGYLLGFLIIAIVSVNKIPASFSALIWISLFLPLIANSITSPRFISVVFVFSFVLGRIVTQNRFKYRVFLFVVLFLLQLLTFQFWLEGSKFSF
jgi:Gpi18-like mannosyltransferase